MDIPHNVELNDENWQGKRSPALFTTFQTLLPALLIPLACFSSAVRLSIEWNLSFSPVVQVLGYPLCLILLLGAFFLFMVTFGLFFGQFHLANATFSLLPVTEFRASHFLMIPFLGLAKVLYISLRHGNPPYFVRLFLLIASCFLIYHNADAFMGFYVPRELWMQAGLIYAGEFFAFHSCMKHEFGKEEVSRTRAGLNTRAGRAQRRRKAEK